MKDVLTDELQFFLKNLLPLGDELLKEMVEYACKKHISIVEPEVGQLLQLLVKIKKPKKILEVGTAIGYSTICMARAADTATKITTIELLPGRIKKAQEFTKRAGAFEKINFLAGDAKEIVPQLQDNYDFIFLDAAKGQYQEFINYTNKILKAGGILVADNVLINGWVIDFSYPERRKKTMVTRMRSFLEDLKNQDDFVYSIIPLGDGVAVLWKKDDEE